MNSHTVANEIPPGSKHTFRIRDGYLYAQNHLPRSEMLHRVPNSNSVIRALRRGGFIIYLNVCDRGGAGRGDGVASRLDYKLSA